MLAQMVEAAHHVAAVVATRGSEVGILPRADPIVDGALAGVVGSQRDAHLALVVTDEVAKEGRRCFPLEADIGVEARGQVVGTVVALPDAVSLAAIAGLPLSERRIQVRLTRSDRQEEPARQTVGILDFRNPWPPCQ